MFTNEPWSEPKTHKHERIHAGVFPCLKNIPLFLFFLFFKMKVKCLTHKIYVRRWCKNFLCEAMIQEAVVLRKNESEQTTAWQLSLTLLTHTHLYEVYHFSHAKNRCRILNGAITSTVYCCLRFFLLLF